jgi:hypothetical protein
VRTRGVRRERSAANRARLSRRSRRLGRESGPLYDALRRRGNFPAAQRSERAIPGAPIAPTSLRAGAEEPRSVPGYSESGSLDGAFFRLPRRAPALCHPPSTRISVPPSKLAMARPRRPDNFVQEGAAAARSAGGSPKPPGRAVRSAERTSRTVSSRLTDSKSGRSAVFTLVPRESHCFTRATRRLSL